MTSGTPINSNVFSAVGGLAAIPSDSTTYPVAFRAVYVGTAGDLAVRMLRDGNILTFRNVAAGTLLPIAVDQVLTTGTTAASVLLLY